jgi:hypothetical protein
MFNKQIKAILFYAVLFALCGCQEDKEKAGKCEQAKYETDLSSGIDINAPGDGENIVLNAVLKCSDN